VSCEARQEQVSLLIDAELEERDQVILFRHLEGCSDCRLFFDSMLRFRKATKRDQEEINLAADEILPRRSPLPSNEPASGHGARHLEARPSGAKSRDLNKRPSGDGTKRRLRVIAGGWRVPAPVAIGLAMALLVAGVLVGTRISILSGGDGPGGRAERMAKPTVVVICSLPEVQVLGSGSRL
jgi:hypothetical protein